jgi:homoserine acetyltransferase
MHARSFGSNHAEIRTHEVDDESSIDEKLNALCRFSRKNSVLQPITAHDFGVPQQPFSHVRRGFGLKSFALVVGGSMGAQQTYEWAVRHSDMVKRAAPIAGTARNTTNYFLFTQTLGRGDYARPRLQQGFLCIRSARSSASKSLRRAG